jgi:hypothetical protein
MHATGWKSSHGGTLGIRVGNENARTYFSPEWKSVTLLLDGQPVQLRLTAAFWRNCPELRGTAIKKFFARHGIFAWPKGKTPKLEMTPLGGDRFSVSLR